MSGAGRRSTGAAARAVTLVFLTLGSLAAGCALEDSGVRSADADSVDEQLVDDCAELVKYQAYVGDARGATVWERAGATEDGLRSECEAIGTHPP